MSGNGKANARMLERARLHNLEAARRLRRLARAATFEAESLERQPLSVARVDEINAAAAAASESTTRAWALITSAHDRHDDGTEADAPPRA